jgi:pimeloyl-ACP methyl ester carboxylesterase
MKLVTKPMSETKLHLEYRGSGLPALVFLHYFAGSARSWRHVVDELADANRCLSLDLPGFGRSPPLPDYSVRTMVQATTGAVAVLDSYILVGHSMGGKLAMAYALARPRGLKGLVLVAPSPPTPEPMDESERSRLLARHGDRASAERIVRNITRHPLPAEDIETCIEDNLATCPKAWRWWLEAGSREDFASEMGRIDCPVLVLAGGGDPVIPPHVATSEVASRIRGAEYREIPGSGHLLPFEAPQEVSRAIGSFALQRHPGA